MIAAWNFILLQPMINFLILLSSVLFHSFGLAIIVLTIIVRLAMLPLTQRQLRSSRAMTALQPKLQEVQKKYAKDRQRLQQEVTKLYKEAGVSPLGCLWPLLIQLPIWIALYQSILRVVAASPEELLGLSQNLYSLSLIHQTVPLGQGFLWLNLAYPDSLFLLPILVGGTMWMQQKMITMPATDPRQQSINRTMLWMMPLVFAFFSLQFPSGLALFWVISNIVGIVIQYFVTGWGGLEETVQGLRAWLGRLRTRAPAPAAPVEETKVATEEAKAIPQKRLEHGKPGDKRKDRGRSRRTRAKKARRSSRRG